MYSNFTVSLFQDWLSFPKNWYKEGILVTDRILKNDPVRRNTAACNN